MRLNTLHTVKKPLLGLGSQWIIRTITRKPKEELAEK